MFFYSNFYPSPLLKPKLSNESTLREHNNIRKKLSNRIKLTTGNRLDHSSGRLYLQTHLLILIMAQLSESDMRFTSDYNGPQRV